MSQPNLDRVKQIFHEVRGETEPERQRLMDELCGEDEALRARVRALLVSEDEAGDFLDSPTMSEANAAALAAASAAASAPPERPGSRIGPYKLLQVIGEGGFGVVYMAEQEEPIRRRVALKVIKPGMDTKQVIARFEAERQALAMLDHPNIAKVFEAGATPNGRPYFVMELVRGTSITDYCDEQRLSTRERLALFSDVCSAVHHAHESGIIHRDLKPSNVMVTLHDGTPVPKVIDFGVAKATHQKLTEKTLFTQYNQFVGTPAYMSPEQAAHEGLDLDKRSDVYSLGVLLYELLTGTTPLDSRELRRAAYIEVLRILKEEEPPKPSTRIHTMGESSQTHAKHRGSDPVALADLLRGDLDWIVMKALEKDRSRRYESASEMAADISRYFNRRPIVARPPSTVYRARKFLGRQRRAIVGLLATLVAVVLAGVVAVAVTRPPEPLVVIKRQVTFTGRASSPALSPDGEMIAYWSHEGPLSDSGQLVVQDLSGGDPLPVVTGVRRFGAPRWSPDGRSLLFTTVLDTTGAALFTVPRLGGLVQRLANNTMSYDYRPGGESVMARVERDSADWYDLPDVGP